MATKHLGNNWFKHDWNARRSRKLTDLKIELGYEGIGIYWCLLEYLYEFNGYLNDEDIKSFCYNEHIEIEKLKKVLQIAKFGYSKEKGHYSKGVLERIEERETFCQNQKEKAQKRWQKKEAPIPEWYEQKKEFEDSKKEKLESLKRTSIEEL